VAFSVISCFSHAIDLFILFDYLLFKNLVFTVLIVFHTPVYIDYLFFKHTRFDMRSSKNIIGCCNKYHYMPRDYS